MKTCKMIFWLQFNMYYNQFNMYYNRLQFNMTIQCIHEFVTQNKGSAMMQLKNFR